MSSKATPKPDNPPSLLRFQFLTIRGEECCLILPLLGDSAREAEKSFARRWGESRCEAHPCHGHYGPARAFAVNPAHKARPFGLRGLTAQRGQAGEAIMPRKRRSGLFAGPARVRSALLSSSGELGTTARKLLTRWSSYKPHPRERSAERSRRRRGRCRLGTIT
jgi:hypothetical protein